MQLFHSAIISAEDEFILQLFHLPYALWGRGDARPSLPRRSFGGVGLQAFISSPLRPLWVSPGLPRRSLGGPKGDWRGQPRGSLEAYGFGKLFYLPYARPPFGGSEGARPAQASPGGPLDVYGFGQLFHHPNI